MYTRVYMYVCTDMYVHVYTCMRRHSSSRDHRDSPQGADEAVDGSLCVQRHDVSDMKETGGRVRHPASCCVSERQTKSKCVFFLSCSSWSPRLSVSLHTVTAGFCMTASCKQLNKFGEEF